MHLTSDQKIPDSSCGRFLQLAFNNVAVVAEWLRRWTRNPLGSARAGSNPADCATFFTLKLVIVYTFK